MKHILAITALIILVLVTYVGVFTLNPTGNVIINQTFQYPPDVFLQRAFTNDSSIGVITSSFAANYTKLIGNDTIVFNRSFYLFKRLYTDEVLNGAYYNLDNVTFKVWIWCSVTQFYNYSGLTFNVTKTNNTYNLELASGHIGCPFNVTDGYYLLVRKF